ncbi:MAG: Alpha-N-acetylgalactosaminidase [Paenibacillus sp.]|nr:Alpha-N-acetylgalactosaminidase [Paenibacillus sp.]
MDKKLNVAVIGVSGRGLGLISNICDMEDVNITVVCDLYEDRMENAANLVMELGGYRPVLCGDYKEAVKRSDVDCVITPSSWTAHREIAIASMKAGKPVGMEVGGACSLHEIWELVRVSEETGIDCMMLENCCYGREELTILNMVKQGLFGELIHCQGGYQHDLRQEIATGLENRHYRFQNYRHRNGEVYPTHEIGPIAKYLDINRGNRFVSLTSMSSKAKGLRQWIVDNKGENHEHAGLDFAQGDIVTTMIKCAHGETIFLIHDTSLPRVYSRGGRVQGTKGIWMEDKKSVYIDGVSPSEHAAGEDAWEPLESYMDKYEHPLWKEFRSSGVKGGHGGMDFLVLRAFFESVMKQTPAPIDVYDTAAWMAVTCLSEESIALGSMPVAFPDFTCGKWMDRKDEAPSKYGLSQVFHDCFEA